MKILHLCLGNFYIDNFSYQENMLPKFHKKMGLDVEIIASLVSFDKDGNPCYLKKAGTYINEYGIPVTRLKFKKSLFSKRLRIFEGLYEALSKSKPDIIFIHNCQFLDIKEVVKYAKQNPDTKIYVDNHADFSNSARNILSKNILHKIIWKHCAQQIEPYTTKFYGVLPARVDFLKKMYKVPDEKVNLLLMGADDEKVEEAKDPNVRKEIREKHNIREDDFLIVTGGKIDNFKKQTLLLMEAVKKIDNDKVKLIVFGSVINELKEEIDRLSDGGRIQYIGWLNSDDCYKYFAAADLAVFPGRHSVLWEQAVGTGIPCIFKCLEGTTHVDVGSSCMFLYKDSVEEIKEKIELVANDKELYQKIKGIAGKEGMKKFSYYQIAKESIGL
ncbi:MAG TPA: glycosyltransferase family 4 protein [Sedimentibacter sp.]|nr:glycosyltransferase family 4 protein [Sedimentibacter sp.]